jgi:hypothetical protein
MGGEDALQRVSPSHGRRRRAMVGKQTDARLENSPSGVSRIRSQTVTLQIKLAKYELSEHRKHR